MPQNDCAADCPVNKYCFASTEGVEGCVVGARMQPNDSVSGLQSPLRPQKRMRRLSSAWPDLGDDSGTPCCEVDTNATFVNTARAIMDYGEQHAVQNPGGQKARDALRDIFSAMPPSDGDPGIFRNDELDSRNMNLSQRQLEDLLQLLERIVPHTGYSATLRMEELLRQPLGRRRKPQNKYWAPDVLRNEVPENALVLATYLEIHVSSQMPVPEVVTLVLRALSDQNVNPDHKYNVTLQTRPRPGDPKITWEDIVLIRDAMESSLFRGTIDLFFAGHQVVLGEDVDHGDHGRVYANQGENGVHVETTIDVYDRGMELRIETMDLEP